jgi:hypothetical protein
MAKSRIESGELAKRFGRPAGSSVEADDPPSGDASSWGDMLFFGTVIVILLAGAGTLAASKRAAPFRQAVWEQIVGPPADNYKSRVAESCDKGWKDDRFNRDQIHCYMTLDIKRLCDPRERRALADKLLAYQAAMDRSEARANAVAFKMIGNRGAVMEMGMAEARSRDPNLSAKERAAQFDRTLEISHDLLSPMDQIVLDNVNTATKAVLVEDVKDLVERGYLAATDFSSTQPKVVKEGLASAGRVSRSSCR